MVGKRTGTCKHMNKYIGLCTVIPATCIVIVSCGSSQPSKSQMTTQLQTELPPYIEVVSFKEEASEDLGNKAEPLIKTRFSAKLKLGEDVFLTAASIPSLPADRQSDVSFIKRANLKGEKIELHGVATSQMLNGEWKTSFDYDTNPFPALGHPRRAFGNGTVLRDSEEEKEYIEKIEKEIEEDKAYFSSLMTEGKYFSGQRSDDKKSRKTPIGLKLISIDEQDKNFVGELHFPDSDLIVEAQGEILEFGIRFVSGQPITGRVRSTGSTYTLEFSNRQELKGRWNGERPARSFGLVPETAIYPDGIVRMSGDVSLTL